MIRFGLSLSAAVLLSTAAFAQNIPNIPAQHDPARNAGNPAFGSKVGPLTAPDATTQSGQEQVNARIEQQSQSRGLQVVQTPSQRTPTGLDLNNPAMGSKVGPLNAPDASTLQGQERGNAQISGQTQSTQNNHATSGPG